MAVHTALCSTMWIAVRSVLYDCVDNSKELNEITVLEYIA